MRPTEILSDVSLSVPEHSIFGFLGANGAGKTTLIHLIVGLRRPVTGEVRLRGHFAASREARMQIGYLPERPYFYEHLTGEGLLYYFGALSGMKRAAVTSRIPQVLSRVGMERARKVELRRYSKGMLQRIGIAQAILHDPEFLVLDEPMSGLDPVGRKEIRELILDLAREGRAIFFSSHVIPDVEAICDRVAVIQKGRIIKHGSTQEFFQDGASEFEVGIAGIGAADLGSLPGLRDCRAVPEGLRLRFTGAEDLSPVLVALLALKARVLWVTPVRPSLESLFQANPLPVEMIRS